MQMLLDLLHHLIEPLLDHPEDLNIDHLDTEDVDIFLISARESDRGHLLGREGKTADSLRTIMQRAGDLADRDIVIDILD